jgi:hypothetical protein
VGPNFLKDNLMIMQAGAVKYTPTNPTGNWTVLCQIPQAAKAIAAGASVETVTGVVEPAGPYISSVWKGTITVPGLDKVYPGKTTYSATELNSPLYMAGTSYFDKSAAWYKDGLPTSSSGAATGGMAPAGYTGTGYDYLNSYFNTGIQTSASATSSAGSSSGEANAQILMKTSAYWVAATHLMYNLDMAAANLATTNGTAAAKANFDSVAASFYGCGETNPVPLPPGPNGSPITYSSVPGSTDTGIGAVTMSIYGLANKRASNYNQYTLRSTTTTGSACTLAGATCKNVANLNILIADALNAGPKADTINQIRDSVLTLFTQASQRYIAKLTLAAHLPGNGMGGSTNPASVIATPATNPTTGSFSTTSFPATGANGVQPTACGGATSYIAPFRQSQDTVAAALNNGMVGAGNTACANNVCASMSNQATGACANGGTVIAGTCTNGQTTGINACSAGSPGGKGVPSTGSVDSNTITFGTVMPSVSMVARASEKAPFAVAETGSLTAADAQAADAGTYPAQFAALALGDTPGGSPNGCGVFTAIPKAGINQDDIGKLCGGLTNSQIQRATRGLASATITGTGATVSSTAPPIACIDSSVCFNDIIVPSSSAAPGALAANDALNGGVVGNSRCVRLCDPKGAPALPGTAATTYAARKAIYATNRISTATTVTNQPTPAVGSSGSGYWDPITAAQASLGGFCCDAQYYSVDGIGRDVAEYGTIATTPAAASAGTSATIPDGTGPQNIGVQVGFVANSQYTTQPTGGIMAQEVSPGVMCPVSSKGGVKGVSKYVNPQQVYQLEGQAFYAVMAGMQRAIVSPVGVQSATQTSNAARQKKCSETITTMMKMNGVSASTDTTGNGPAGAVCSVADSLSAVQTTTQQYCRGTDKSAIQFPTWSVAIGAGTASTVTKYNVPNGYCYANKCFDDLMTVATEPGFKGVTKLGVLVSSPDMGSNPTATGTSCGRANGACTAAPTGWTGGEVVMEKCSTAALANGNTGCDATAIQKQFGVIPTA